MTRMFFSKAKATMALVVLIVVCTEKALAVDVETLPAGVRMSQARFGVVSGLDQTWAPDSKLYDLGDTRSVTFNAANLARVNDRAKALVRALDYFGTHDLGEKIQLGTLNVSTTPEVSYFAPVMAYGLSNTWTVGVGVPVVHYTNHIALSASNSNLDFYRTQFQGISHELDAVLNVDLATEAQKVLAQKGYRRMSDRDQVFVGDLQVALAHRLNDLGRWSFMHQITFQLPTGPKDDPDDLMALNAFSRASIENTLIAAYPLTRKWTVFPYAGVLIPVPDKTTKRVPKNEDDNIPDPESKQELGRTVAPTASVGGEVRWAFADRWDVKQALEGSAKGTDRYEGSGRMDLLEQNTDSEVLRVRGGLTYSTVDDYKLGKSPVPGRVSLEVSDTLQGRNIERQLRTDLTAMLFF